MRYHNWKCSIACLGDHVQVSIPIYCYMCKYPWHKNRLFFHSTSILQWDLYCSESYKVALSQSLSFVGMLLGAWFLGPLADKIGRRKVYLYSSLTTFIATFVSAVSITYTQFALARFFIGFGGAGCILCLFVILMEIIGPDYRASAGIIISGFFSIGFILLSVVAYVIPGWRLMTVIFSGLGFFHLFFYK